MYKSHFKCILVPIRDVWAVKDGKAELPCDIAPPDPTDQVIFISKLIQKTKRVNTFFHQGFI